MAYAPLSLLEREEISRELVADPTAAWTTIGDRIGRHRTTVMREVTHNGGRLAYRAAAATERAAILLCRPRLRWHERDPLLAVVITDHLRRGFSPAGTAALVARTGPGVVTETIYHAVYAGDLDVKPRDCLRTRRPRRRRRCGPHEPANQHPLAGAPSIHDRPAHVEDRVIPGDWEGDLIIGKRNQSAMVTLIERVTRFTLLARLPCGYDSTEVLAALLEAFGPVPAWLRTSLTWDRGSEMAQWPLLADALSMPVYFADPHSPWQRGTNEHNNRLLRWWLPRGIDLGAITDHRTGQILDVLNHQPRRSLNWETPAERYHPLAVR